MLEDLPASQKQPPTQQILDLKGLSVICSCNSYFQDYQWPYEWVALERAHV